jgi:RNA polymerase sigma-70 factor (ECF subfamily)
VSDTKKNNELLKHLDAAYNLARWLLKNEQDARDVVQDAFIRAFRSSSDVENVKTWFLAIVRNTSFTALKKRPLLTLDGDVLLDESADSAFDPERLAIQQTDMDSVRAALLLLREEHREVFVLREIEELSYSELSETLSVPIGTIMSRLARARSKIVEIHKEMNPSVGGRYSEQ